MLTFTLNWVIGVVGWPLWNICVTNDHGYVSLVVNISRSFPHSRLITGFVTRLIRRVPLVEQELLTLPEHLRSPPVLSDVCVTRSLVLYVCFVDRCLSLCTFSFGHCVICSSSIYGFWLLLLVSSNSSCKEHGGLILNVIHYIYLFFVTRCFRIHNVRAITENRWPKPPHKY